MKSPHAKIGASISYAAPLPRRSIESAANAELMDGARVDGEPPLTEVRGRFLVARGLIATAVTMPCVD